MTDDWNKNNAHALHLAFEESPIPTVLYSGTDMHIAMANKAWMELWHKDSTVIGRSFYEVFPELSDQAFGTQLELTYTKGITFEDKEYQTTITLDGIPHEFCLSVSLKPLTDPTGSVGAVLNTMINVSESVRARKRADKAEKRMQFMLQSAAMGSWDIDLIEQTVWWDEKCRELFGNLEGNRGTYQDILECIDEADTDRFTKALTLIAGIAPDKAYSITVRTKRSNNKPTRWLECKGRAYHTDDQSATRFAGIVHDVTARIQLEQEQLISHEQLVVSRQQLVRSENRFRDFILEAPMPTALYTEPEIRISMANEAMLMLWDKDTSVIGLPFREALPELNNQPFPDLLERVFTTGIAYHTDRQSADLMRDGEMKTFWFNFTYKPLFDETGNVYGILHMAVDISSLVQLERQKDEFLGVASHELKTPVTSIKAYIQLLERTLLQENNQGHARMVGKMDQQVNRLTHLINDLLDVTKVQSGRLQFSEEIFNFDDLVREVAEDLQRTSESHRIETTTESNAFLFADRERIGQVIVNLITNAIKYSPGKDRVIVESWRDGTSVTLTVQDFGIGITSDNKSRVFEQFYRASGILQHTFPGLGLGLYISSEIIKRAGGRIWVESAVGEGSTFGFKLPAGREKSI